MRSDLARELAIEAVFDAPEGYQTWDRDMWETYVRSRFFGALSPYAVSKICDAVEKYLAQPTAT